MDELIRLSKKAANEWRNTDAYYQAAVLIDSLCDRLEKAENGNQQTNADRIRAMSDEELGRFLAKVENRRSATGGGAIWKGAAHAIQWLKQPAEE